MRDIIDEIITKIEAEFVDGKSDFNRGLNKALEIVNAHKKSDSWKLTEDKMSEALGEIQKSVDTGTFDSEFLDKKIKEIQDLQILLGGEGFDGTN